MTSLSPADFFLRIKEIIGRPYAPSSYFELYKVMRHACAMKAGGKVYSNFFTMLGCVCRDNGVDGHMAAALQDLRRRCGGASEKDADRFLTDALLLSRFIEIVSGESMPNELKAVLPPFWDVEEKARPKAVGRYKVLRARILDWDDHTLTVRVDSSLSLPDPATVYYAGIGAGNTESEKACAHGEERAIYGEKREHSDDKLELSDDKLERSDDKLERSDGKLEHPDDKRENPSDNFFAAPYLRDIIHKDSTVNLLDAQLLPDGSLLPRWIILEPDFLMSPSELAAVFEPQGARPELYLLKAFQPGANTFYTLLGNTSGQFLDDLVFETPASPASYASSLIKAFRRAPVDFSLLMQNREDAQRFHNEARTQFNNLAQIIRTQMEQFYGFDLKKALLEPSFVCPAAGLAGRMDYLQSDATRLIEQKSGKRDEFRHTHREPHFVQMMLYRLMLDYTVGTDRNKTETYLLYSRYIDGLMLERPYMTLLGRAIEMRNRIVSLIERVANGGSEEIFSHLRVEDFRDEGVSDKFWIPYARPRLEAAITPFTPKANGEAVDKELPLIVRSFFFRFYDFLMREQWLGRMGRTGGNNGGDGVGTGGYADLWNNPAMVKLEGGDMLMGLQIKDLITENNAKDIGKTQPNTANLPQNTANLPQGAANLPLNTGKAQPNTANSQSSTTNKRANAEKGSVVGVVFRVEARMRKIRTNFRVGDSVQIYSYDGEEPEVWRQFTLRGRLAKISPDEVEVMLQNPQHNRDIFSVNRPFALEHDRVESGNNVMDRGLFAFLTASPAIQNRFLLRTLPPSGSSSMLLGNYGDFNPIIQQERAAKDLFLVIGPPGSGKTSCALRYMVEEELRAMQSDVPSATLPASSGAPLATNDAHSTTSVTHRAKKARGGCILLMAYTNRAVDELCFMLEDIIKQSPALLKDYLRLGNELGASPELRGRLLSNRAQAELKTANDVLGLLGNTRVVVATTSTMSRQQLLMDYLHFDVAFVDEASQILEPYLLPVLMQGSVDKLVLVGDQKQLPAVVVQSSVDAAIRDERLNSLGFTSCAHSMFHRMLHRLISMGRTDLFALLRTQGRMHPALFDFVNHNFYNDNLRCVPLHHQQRPLSHVYPRLPVVNSNFARALLSYFPAQSSVVSALSIPTPTVAALLSALATHRVLFIDCKSADDGVNDKINSREALAAALCLRLFSVLYEENGRKLTARDAGIIVPYRNQISMVTAYMEELGLDALNSMSIDTVERYQGSQRDIIIYSFTVRHAAQLDFLTSSTYQESDNPERPAYSVDRKLNVALTRAREQTVLIGNASLLRRNPIFRAMLEKVHVFHLD